MRRIKRLEDRLDRRTNEYDRRLKQLECEHDIEAVRGWDSWSGKYIYWTQCKICKKDFGRITEKEYIALSLKLNKEKCSKESAELTKRLAELKKE